MKKLFIILGVLISIVIGFYLFKSLGNGLAGGGGSEQIVADTAKTEQSITIGLILSTWGKHNKPISERYANISLHYRLVGESNFKTVQPHIVGLPDNYKSAISDNAQYEKLEFTIPSYNKGVVGQIEYYTDMTFDGYPSRVEGVKKINLVD